MKFPLTFSALLLVMIFTGFIGNLSAQITDTLTSRFLENLSCEKYGEAVAFFSDDLSESYDTAWLQKKHELYNNAFGQAEIRDLVLKSFYGNKHIVCRFMWYGDQSVKFRFVIQGDEIAEISIGKESITNAYSLPEYAGRKDVVLRPVLIRSGKYALPGEIVEPAGESAGKWVVFVHGSGPANRDEAMFGNRPFKDIAYGLAKHGISSLRYDKNTYLFGPELSKEDGMTMWDETGNDAVSAFNYLKKFEQVKSQNIYMLGHSQGAMMMPAICDSIEAGGAIMIAGNARPLHKLMYEQFRFLMKQDGLSKAEKRRLDIQKEHIENLKKLKNMPVDSVDFAMPYGLPASYWKYLLEYDQTERIKEIDEPVLLLQGKGDYQVRMRDFRKFRRALLFSDLEWKAIAYDKVNHLLFENQGKPSKEEYNRNENVEGYIIEDIANWIQNK